MGMYLGYFFFFKSNASLQVFRFLNWKLLELELFIRRRLYFYFFREIISALCIFEQRQNFLCLWIGYVPFAILTKPFKFGRLFQDMEKNTVTKYPIEVY